MVVFTISDVCIVTKLINSRPNGIYVSKRELLMTSDKDQWALQWKFGLSFLYIQKERFIKLVNILIK